MNPIRKPVNEKKLKEIFFIIIIFIIIVVYGLQSLKKDPKANHTRTQTDRLTELHTIHFCQKAPKLKKQQQNKPKKAFYKANKRH